MEPPKTIDITTSAVLFQDADPVGLLREESAGDYLRELRTRIEALYPKARVFLRWSPSSNDGVDVYTIPRVKEAEDKLVEVAEEIRIDPSWLNYDESVRSSFGAN